MRRSAGFPIIRAVMTGMLMICLTAGMLAAGARPASAQELIFQGDKLPLTVFSRIPSDEELLELGLKAPAMPAAETAQTEETVQAEEETTEADPDAAAIEEALAIYRERYPLAYDQVEADSIDILGILNHTHAVVLYQVTGEHNGLPDVSAPSYAGDSAETDAAGEIVQAGNDASNIRWGYVSLEDLDEKIPDLDLSALPQQTAWIDIFPNDMSEDVTEMQQLFIDAGRMDAEPDGSYGPGTRGVVDAFQTEHGFYPDGVINICAWFLLAEEAAGGAAEPLVLNYPPVYTVEEKFADIHESITDPFLLQYLLDPYWVPDYDAAEKRGLIRNRQVISAYVDDDDPQEHIHIDLHLAVYLQENDGGRIQPVPVILAESVGTFAPGIHDMVLKWGTEELKLPLVNTDTVNGAEVIEESCLAFTTDAGMAMLGSGFGSQTAQSLTAQLVGSAGTYDLKLTGAANDLYDFVASTAADLMIPETEE